MTLPEQWEHASAETADLAIRQYRFESISDFRPVLVLIYREQNHNTAVLAFRSHTPFLEETIRKILSRIAFERMDGYDGELGIRFLIQLLTESGDFLPGIGIDDAGEIIHVTLRRELLDFFRRSEIRREAGAESKNPERQNKGQCQRGFHSKSDPLRLTKPGSSATVIAVSQEKER